MDGGGVSVIIAAHRAHDTIARAVSSLLDQGWADWEAVVVSDDGTDYRATLEAAGLSGPRLVFTSTGRIGAGAPAARNAGLRAASKPLVAPLDADDRFLPGRLARLAPLALRHGAAVDNVAVVRDRDGAPLSTLFPPTEGVGELDADGFLATSVPMFPVVRRDLVPGWEEDVNFCDDVVFNVQVIDRVGPLPLVGQPLYEYRQREGSITFSADSGDRAERCYRHVLARLEGDGLRIQDEMLRRRFAAALEAKRALNAAYEAAHRGGRCANFQEFLALREKSLAG
ncbi:glycosyltransferase family 2 protein [Azospirillum rugosum]|uniref:Glycosyltransferase involved in cell wall biosynthesis n=1 Tax=Azospirillum rugosum TaxID=416170 RepID=A0ABS4SPK1_9PROT|nr:glycosyltransferase family 2 protein [Azospirillum rugosum]MBP2294470.1 glycosyltransferase involved in cell wall biosynthesis [Azospirillum rugosum]MDQ0528975.1 glycosyltransferase involved in cell wall biosynthesis [Azospirillum rugosum]